MPLKWHLVTPNQILLLYLVLLASPEVMEIDGRDIKVRKESVLVEQDGAFFIVCHVEAIRQELVLEVFNSFL